MYSPWAYSSSYAMVWHVRKAYENWERIWISVCRNEQRFQHLKIECHPEHAWPPYNFARNIPFSPDMCSLNSLFHFCYSHFTCATKKCHVNSSAAKIQLSNIQQNNALNASCSVVSGISWLQNIESGARVVSIIRLVVS